MSEARTYYYMIEFILDNNIKDSWRDIMNDFKCEIEKLYDTGNLTFITTSKEYDKAWIIIKCGSESELLFLMEDLSILRNSIYQYTQLSMVESAHELPLVCLN